MNKKKRMILLLATVFAMSTCGLVNAQTRTGTISGATVVGSCSISSTSGSASTTINISSSATVSATYSYVNTTTLSTGTSSNGTGGANGGGVSFSAPGGCRSVKITASHNAYYNYQSWSATTSETY